jgi:hypothetical protein
MSSYPQYWRLESGRALPCSEAEWKVFRNDASKFLLARRTIEPWFVVQTQFIGCQKDVNLPPDLFRISVFSDLGESIRTARTLSDAAMMHEMVCQRIEHVVAQNEWSFT